MNSRRRILNFVESPEPQAFRRLLALAVAACRYFSLTLRPAQEQRRPDGVLQRLDPFTVGRRATYEWPGTLTGEISGASQLLIYRFDAEAASTTADINPNLYGWRMFSYPEDFCLYRPDGTVWLGSIAHENDAFLVLEPEEEPAVRSALPDLCLEPGDPKPMEMYTKRDWISAAR